MADNFEQCTVEPFIPEGLVTELELALLDGFGFRHEKDGKDRLYFFAEESVNNEFYGAIERDVLEQDTSPLAKRIRDYLVKSGLDNDTAPIEELPSNVVTWEGVFQTVLSKPENRGKDRIKEVVAKAAFTCSKMRPGEFGGWVTYITPKVVKSDGTHGLLDRLRGEDNLYEALSTVMELAEGNALDPAEVDAEQLPQARKQRRVIRVVRRFLDNMGA